MSVNIPQTPSPRENAMRVGLEMGLWFAAAFILEAQQLAHPALGYLAVFVEVYILFGICRAGQFYKIRECHGRLKFGGAYKYVLWLFLCSSLVASVVRFIYLEWIDKAYLSAVYANLTEVIAAAEKSMKSANTATDMLSGMQMLFTPIRYTVYMILSDLLNGVFWGLFLALYISRCNPRLIILKPGEKLDDNGNVTGGDSAASDEESEAADDKDSADAADENNDEKQ